MTQTAFANDSGLEDVLQYISGLRIDDIDNLQSHNALGDVSLSDEDLAKLLFAQEAGHLLNITRDHIAGPSGSASANTLIDELIAMEEMARFDHEYALALSEDRPLPVRPERRLVMVPEPVRNRTPESESSDEDSDADELAALRYAYEADFLEEASEDDAADFAEEAYAGSEVAVAEEGAYTASEVDFGTLEEANVSEVDFAEERANLSEADFAEERADAVSEVDFLQERAYDSDEDEQSARMHGMWGHY
ncbi:hypothetical protein EUX98_g7161 [Antrodiella citrinella]|uniref:Uncharacterized protein n=1 Tax=Antrodiella citrinella TaxID=2447956 RepID=A0A4S4MM68_9APHY|nr:hypothetical protein EUX98_g7161 [Antrodiella citrinella]